MKKINENEHQARKQILLHITSIYNVDFKNNILCWKEINTLCVGMVYNVVNFAILTGMKYINNTVIQVNMHTLKLGSYPA